MRREEDRVRDDIEDRRGEGAWKENAAGKADAATVRASA